MIAQELEVSLHMAFVEARQKRHEFITVEHLLLALLDNPTAAEVLRACGANMDELLKIIDEQLGIVLLFPACHHRYVFPALLGGGNTGLFLVTTQA